MIQGVSQKIASGSSTTAGLLSALPVLERFPVLATLLGLTALLGAATLALYLLRRTVVRTIVRVAARTRTAWDEILLDSVVLTRISRLLPILVVHQGLALVPHLSPGVLEGVRRLLTVLFILVVLRVLSALLEVANQIYSRFPTAAERPIKGFLQVVGIVVYFAGAILAVASLLDQSPWILFSGLGAMTAVLMLVFRDTILSLVAGVQLTANDLIRVGDWIEMPQFAADGDVVDIALNSVSVKNWDKTITVIPTHKFLENSFKNWRGMQETGGRRIKRSLFIDMSTIRFLEPEEIERFGGFALLRDYVAAKVAELEEYNRTHATGPDVTANARRLTNVGMLRAYVTAYLRQHPQIHQDLTFLVRQLAPTAEGLPLEIYVFTTDIRWANYEGIQGDIFDHLLAVLPEFGLRTYQKPSGADLESVRAALPLPATPVAARTQTIELHPAR